MKKWIVTGILAMMLSAQLIGCSSGTDKAPEEAETGSVEEQTDEGAAATGDTEDLNGGNQASEDQNADEQNDQAVDDQNADEQTADDQNDDDQAASGNGGAAGMDSAEECALGKFTTLDLEGHTVTQDFYKGYDLTVVNVWGTFCGPCISEMPELGRWARNLPDNVQLIGIICDVYTMEEYDAYEEFEEACAEAEMILEDTGANYTNIVTSSDMTFMADIMYVPTTFFIDGNGQIVGEAIVGANVSKYKNFVEEYFE